jgi:hypothetical protein
MYNMVVRTAKIPALFLWLETVCSGNIRNQRIKGD